MLNVVENDASLGGIGEGMSDKGVGSVSRLGAPVTAPFFVPAIIAGLGFIPMNEEEATSHAL